MTNIHIDSSEKREELPEFDEEVMCPSCNAVTMPGFGLAGGGFGPYTVCTECGDVVTKSADCGDE